MAEKKKKLSGFSKGVLIYTAVLVVISAVLLLLLYGFVSAYEQSRPYNSMEKYLASIDENALPEDCEAVIPSLDKNIRTEAESRALIKELISGARFSKAVKLCTEDRLVYTLTSGDQHIGNVYLKQNGKSSFGFEVWEPVDDEYELSPFINQLDISLPQGYTVSLNGSDPGDEYVADRKTQYSTLSSCYEYYDDLPYLNHFESGRYIGDADLRIFDPSGKEVSGDELSESVYLNNCSPDMEKQLKDFSDEVIRRYVQLCANIDGNEIGNYIHIKEIIVPGSQLHDRMRISLYALGYSSVRSCDITSSTMKICSDLGNGKYFTDLNYVTEIVGLDGPVSTEQNIQFVISYDSLNQLKAEAMFNY